MSNRSEAPSVEGFRRVSFWREESIGVVTLLPPGLIDNQLMEELVRVFSIAAIDDKVSSLLLTGSNYVFSKGLSLPENRSYADLRDYYKRAQSLVLFWISLEKPIFSAINGTTKNNGLSLALLADTVFYSGNSKFSLDDEEPTIFLGSLTIPQKISTEGDKLSLNGIRVQEDEMMKEVFEKSKNLQKIRFHRFRRSRLSNFEMAILQEELDFLDYYLWCEGC